MLAWRVDRMLSVSIHAPRAGRDGLEKIDFNAVHGFNPRAPCGARPPVINNPGMVFAFQSTRPVRGATGRACIFSRLISGFNPRAPCGARPQREAAIIAARQVSIHAPRAGRDIPISTRCIDMSTFQSTRPVRGATSRAVSNLSIYKVSIHAPRAGRDSPVFTMSLPGAKVSIHAPRAGRDALMSSAWTLIIKFQSTRPVRGATRQWCSQPACTFRVSIHAPRAGRDGHILSDCYR